MHPFPGGMHSCTTSWTQGHGEGWLGSYGTSLIHHVSSHHPTLITQRAPMIGFRKNILILLLMEGYVLWNDMRFRMTVRKRLQIGEKNVFARELRDGTNTDVLRVLEQIEQHLSAIRNGDAKPSREWLTILDVADELQVSRDTIERLIGSGRLQAAEIITGTGAGQRHRYRVRREWLDQYLMANTTSKKPATNHALRAKKGNGEVDFICD